MKNEKRACIAYMCGTIVNALSKYSSVYDFTNRKYCNYHRLPSGVENGILVYDYERGGYVEGVLPNLYDYISKTYIQIRVDGERIQGYDNESVAYYIVEVIGNDVRIYDYEKSTYFLYRVL